MASLSQRDAKARNEAGVPLIFWSLCGSARYRSDFPGVFRVEILIYLAFLYTILTFYKDRIRKDVKSVTRSEPFIGKSHKTYK